MATYDVSDRSAIVTGAGSGIGRAVAVLLAANGASVLVADVKPEAADAVVAEIVEADESVPVGPDRDAGKDGADGALGGVLVHRHAATRRGR